MFRVRWIESPTFLPSLGQMTWLTFFEVSFFLCKMGVKISNSQRCYEEYLRLHSTFGTIHGVPPEGDFRLPWIRPLVVSVLFLSGNHCRFKNLPLPTLCGVLESYNLCHGWSLAYILAPRTLASSKWGCRYESSSFHCAFTLGTWVWTSRNTLTP